jgi:DNA-directed RNA polymerase subunit RPC12/RpoP
MTDTSSTGRYRCSGCGRTLVELLYSMTEDPDEIVCAHCGGIAPKIAEATN